MFDGPLTESIVKRAVASEKVTIELHQLRDYALDKHGTVDDTPYGGGAGMVLKVDVMDQAIQDVVAKGQAALGETIKPYTILMTPQGRVFNQTIAREFSTAPWIILICGHYEGYDERIRQLVNDEISIGDYVLTGGELPAMIITDAIVRLLPDVLGKEASHLHDSHENGLLEHPHYTRPDVYRRLAVPEALKSGNHALIEKWRKEESHKRTLTRRPDLLDPDSVDKI